ncbi:hypothetical protein MRX96_058018 [Rhipicephalus microplus]
MQRRRLPLFPSEPGSGMRKLAGRRPRRMKSDRYCARVDELVLPRPHLAERSPGAFPRRKFRRIATASRDDEGKGTLPGWDAFTCLVQCPRCRLRPCPGRIDCARRSKK